MLNYIGELFLSLIPPHDGDPEKIYRWRVLLAGTVIVMAGTFGTHIALAWGFMPAFFPGFASASEVRDVVKQQSAMRVESLGDALYNMQKDQCIARHTGNLQAAQTQDQRIREKRAAYRDISGGQNYELPPCDLFVSR